MRAEDARNGTAEVTRVRYAWADAPYVNLFSGDDLPAAVFHQNLHPPTPEHSSPPAHTVRFAQSSV